MVCIRPTALRQGVAFALAVALFAAAPTALADGKGRFKDPSRWHDPRWQDSRWQDDGRGRFDDRRDRGGGEYDWARVVRVDPLVRRVRVDVPERECWDERRWSEPRPRPGVAGPMILGGAIGAAAGNQIGSGDGRRAATVAGAIIGSAIGHDVGERRRDRHYDEPRAYSVERCDVRYVSRWDERIEGYDVTYEYHGRHYQTRLPYDPGRELRVRVAVEPAGR